MIAARAAGNGTTRPAPYPVGHAARDRYVLARRGARPARDAWRHQGIVVEPERNEAGSIDTAATVFLTGRECPWHCVMCDLWQYTTAGDTPAASSTAARSRRPITKRSRTGSATSRE